MADGVGDAEALSRFSDDAKAAGLALPTARKFDLRIAAVAIVVIVVASTAVGFATNWFNVNHPAPNPLSQLPGCGGGGTSVSTEVEAGSSGGLANSWSSLSTAFGAATGSCLTVASTTNSTGLSSLAAKGTDAVIGPSVPTPDGATGLAAATYDLPLFVAPVVVLVNTEGVAPHVNLSASALAGAYLGSVVRWSDPTLTATNPGLSSTESVTVVYLSDPNEANAVFSTYLAAWNSTYRSTEAPGPNVSWPVGTEATSPQAVPGLVAATPGAIGYVPTDLCPTVTSPVVCASVQTGAAGFALPTRANVALAANLEANSTAASTNDWANVTGVAPTNSSAYPMLETTYAVLYRDLGTAYGTGLSFNASKWLIALVFWVESNTSGTAGIIDGATGYFALPSGVALASAELTLNITYNGAWILLPPGALQEGYGESGEGSETGEF